MMKRALSLFLAVILMLGLLVLPASAASAKDVHTYLMNIAKEGRLLPFSMLFTYPAA